MKFITKDIGSIFPLYEKDYSKTFQKNSPLVKDRVLVSLARESFSLIADLHQNLSKHVLIPAYTCQTCITPFLEKGWNCKFYPITKDLRIDTIGLKSLCKDFQPSIVVVHPYYGMDLSNVEVDALQSLHDDGILLVKDDTQCIFTTQKLNFIDYTIGSYRKWFPIPDGGFIQSSNNLSVTFKEDPENNLFYDFQTYSMYLRGIYFKSGDERVKQISISLNKKAVALVENSIKVHRMSDFSATILSNENLESNIMSRNTNFRYLSSHIVNNEFLSSVYHELPDQIIAPLYFPIYVKNRTDLQKVLAQNHIYAPILWKVELEDVLINNDIADIYDQILVIPIDQRYDINDMKKIANTINSYYGKM